MRKNRNDNFSRFITLLTVAITLLSSTGGCGLFDDKGSSDVYHSYITDLKVDPPSGSSTFNLTVEYSYTQLRPGNRPATIVCEYVRPDAIEGDIGAIMPLPPGGQSPADGSKVINRQMLAFSVVRPDGSVQEGQYKARCSTELGFNVEAPFTVERVEAEVNPPAAEVAPASTEATEPVITPTAMPTLKLQMEMARPGKGYILTGKWGGDLVVNPDGAIRAKIPGTFSGVVGIDMNNGTNASYNVDVSFNVDVAGMAEFTPDGVKLRLQQTYADYQVKPVSIASGSIDGTTLAACKKAIEEAAPNWLDQILTSHEIQANSLPLTQDSSVGAWKGKLTLSLAQ